MTQTVLTLCALVLSILVFTNLIQYWHIIIIALLIGFANTIDMPARQSFIIEMIGREDLMNAIALNSAVFNMARIIGPSIAGIAIHLIGIGYCFLINSISFIPVIIGLFFIKPVFTIKNITNNNIFKDIKEGLKYIFSVKIIFWTMVFVFIIGTFGMNFNVLVPVYSKTVLNQGETGFGFLMSCMGIGSLLGAISIAVMSKHGPKRMILSISSIITAVLFILIGINRYFIAASFLLALIGFSNVTFFTTANSTLQLNSLDKFRGRVLSVYTLMFGGTTPFGNIFVGSISDFFGAKYGFISCSIAILFFIGILFLFNLRTKKIKTLSIFN